MRTTVYVFLIDQVELKLECSADGQAHLVELADNLAQHFTRIREERRAFQLVHGHQELCGRTLLPGLIAESVGDWIADSVSVTDVQTQTGAFHRRAVDIQCE